MTPDIEIVIAGAGISGIGAAIACLRNGHRSLVLLEAADDLGGTWRDNTYPGIAVDIPSGSYCFPFHDDFPWSRTFAPGAEIQRYVRHCAETYGVTSHIRYGARVVRSDFDAAHDTWTTRLADGSTITSRYVIAATGVFGHPRLPDIPGLDTFAGKTMHTARWDHEHDLTGTRVAIVGTGASAVQVVPEIAGRVAELRVFQRTPIWISPRMERHLPRFASEALLQFLTFAIVNYRRFPFIVRAVQRSLRGWMRRQVADPATAEKLLPRYGLGCKRPAPSNEYLRAFNRDNVRLITEPIARVCARGIVTRDGVVHEADTLILATGFLTTEQGNAPSFEVAGPGGVELGAFWSAHGRQAYDGIAVAGFPNFFLTSGPYSGGFNWFTMLTAHLDRIVRCLNTARARHATRVEVRQDVHDRYVAWTRARAAGTVFMDASCRTANSYYIDRRGDASLALPYTPWWRTLRGYVGGTRAYRFTSSSEAA